MGRARQMSLLGGGSPAIDARFSALRRRALDAESWIDVAPSWVSGHEALLDELTRDAPWETQKREMYDRTVDVPRLVAALPADGGPGRTLITEMQRVLEARYGAAFPRVSLALYRDGNDSVAWHGDQVARRMRESLVATVSLGAPRRFLLRPKVSAGAGGDVGGARSHALMLGWGDLVVMGGACQRTWEHSVPKVAFAEPRIALMLRPRWPEP